MNRQIPRWIVRGERLMLVCPACGSKKPVRYDKTAACCGMVHRAPEEPTQSTINERDPAKENT